MYIRFPLSLRNVEDLLHERGIGINHEAVRFWWQPFGPMFAAVHASVYNLFNTEHSLSSRAIFKLNRAAALSEWRGLLAARRSSLVRYTKTSSILSDSTANSAQTSPKGGH